MERVISMATERFGFAEFLAVLEAKRAALDALIASYRAAVSVGALGTRWTPPCGRVGGS